MKFSKLEGLLLLMTVAFFTFSAGWFLGGRAAPAPFSVTAERQDEPLPSPSANPAPGLTDGERINLNTASAEELTRLPGIGEKRAGDIVSWRDAHGPFSAPEELLLISGIGSGIFEGISDYITVDEG